MRRTLQLVLGTALLVSLGAAVALLRAVGPAGERASRPAASVAAPDEAPGRVAALAEPRPRDLPQRTAPEAPGSRTVTGDLQVLTEVTDSYGERVSDYAPMPASGRGRVRFVPIGTGPERGVIDRPLPPGGPLTFAGLPEGDWIVDVFEPAFGPSRDVVRGNEPFYDLLYDGIEVTLDVRLPDGTQPHHAFVTFVDREYVASWRFDPRTAARQVVRDLQPWARMDDWEFFHWAPSDPRIAVEVGDGGVPSDLLVIAGPRGPEAYDATQPCRFVSSFVRVEAGRLAPVLAELEETVHLSVAVDAPEALVRESKAYLAGVRRVVVGGVDSATFLTSVAGSWYEAPHGPAFFAHPEFDTFARGLDGDGSYEVTYLAPGAWSIGARWEGEGCAATHEVELALGWNTAQLAFGQPATRDFVPVRFECRPGLATPAHSELDFAVVAGEPPRVTSEWLTWSHGTNGELWLARTELAELLAAAGNAEPVRVVALFEDRRGGRVGFASEPLVAGMPALGFSELPGARLVVRVRSGRSGTPEFALRATLLAPTDELARAIGEADREALGRYAWQHDLDGGVGSTVLPGRWRVEVDVYSAPMTAPESREVDVGRDGAVTEVEFVIPDRHSVRVHAPSLAPGERLRLRRAADAPDAAATRGPMLAATVDDGGRVEFVDVPAGHYEVCLGTATAPLRVVVPCGEVLYEPLRADAFELRLAPLADGSAGAFARAGFRSGDVLLAFDAHEVRRFEDLDALLDVVAAGTGVARVRRGLNVLELSLGPMPDMADPWATLDADFVPAWR